MLQHLTIENYALIQSLSITFKEGFSVITGETGAGKSIILGALHLILGQRADTQALFDPEKKCLVEGAFSIKALELNSFFEENDIDYEDITIIRREVSPTGKSRAFINDSPVSLQLLKELASQLIDIHSQHQTLTLNNAWFQMQLLDLLSHQSQTILAYFHAFSAFTSLKNQWEKLKLEDQKNKSDIDYTQFLYDELQEVQLKEGELQELEQRLTLIKNAELIKQTFTLGSQVLTEGEYAVCDQLTVLKNSFSKITGLRSDFEKLLHRIESSVVELKDMAFDFTTIDEAILFSPEKQEEVTQRLDILYRLLTKHHVLTVEELILIETNLDNKLHSMANLSTQLSEIEQKVSETKEVVLQIAKQLSTNRLKAAEILQQQIAPILHQLSMKDAELKVIIDPLPEPTKTGTDEVRFLFKANKGGEFREIEKVASGGELSRLMLAIKSLITQNTLLPTIIFDEIDSGVSGGIAAQVGRIMQLMSKHMQVLAITHLPQIAAKADQHFKVYKSTVENRTISVIKLLQSEERTKEIAFMLSSGTITDSTIQTAKELMQS